MSINQGNFFDEKNLINSKKNNKSLSILNSDNDNKEEEKKNSEEVNIINNNDDYFISKFDLIKQRYPCCIVWTPIPCITWLIPNIGHMGICNSKGIIHDFAGSYFVSQDNMTFGNPTKYIKLKIKNKDIKKYDECVEKILLRYDKKLVYNFFCNNCHSFVAGVLNEFKYENKINFGIFNLWWKVNIESKYVNCKGFFKTYLGFFILLLIIGIIVLLVLLL